MCTRRGLVTAELRDDLPDIPGVRERWGGDLLHCPYCHEAPSPASSSRTTA
jgi:hypothetical protein